MRIRIRGLVAAVAGLGLAIGTGLWSPASAELGWQIEGYNSAKCVGAQNNSGARSTQIELRSCDLEEIGTYYDFVPTSGGYYRIKNINNQCLNVKGNTSSASAKIIQYPCGGSASLNDQWYPDPVGRLRNHDFYLLRSRHYWGMCLNVQGNSSSIGADLIQYYCETSSHADYFTWYYAF